MMFTCECLNVHDFLIHLTLAQSNCNHIYSTSVEEELRLILSYFINVCVSNRIWKYELVTLISSEEYVVQFKCYYRENGTL